MPAGELVDGEQLDGRHGPVTVALVTPVGYHRSVYNLEVHGQHVYRVANDAVLVHNGCPDNGAAAATKNRVKLRKQTKEQIDSKQPRNADGEMIDPYSGEPLKPGEIDIGHNRGEEWRKRKKMHEEKGSTRKEVLDEENDPDLYQLEDRSSNRSHKHEEG